MGNFGGPMEDVDEKITRATTINLVVSWVVLRTCSYETEKN